jgi:hypothetical protein
VENADEGGSQPASDVGGPSSCPGNNHPVSHDGGDGASDAAKDQSDGATHEAGQGHADTTIDDQSHEV